MDAIEQYVPAWLLAIVGIAVAVTTVTALARKPPLTWIGHWFAWVFRRLIGEPIAVYVDAHFREQVLPIIREEVDPINEKLQHLHDCLERVGQEGNMHAATAAAFAEEAREAAIAAKETARDAVTEASFTRGMVEETGALLNAHLRECPTKGVT